MFPFLALTTLVAVYATCLGWTLAARRRSAGLAGVVAAALTVSVEAIVLGALSLLHWVDREWLLFANGIFVGGSLLALRYRSIPWPRLPRWRKLRWWEWCVAALGALALVEALAYLPNNWDSMTYHLARVAYWWQNRSVAPYPTSIMRQGYYTPGAEYLILLLQTISGTDRLDALVQFFAWVLVVCAAIPLARSFGAPREIARLGVLLVGAAPMAIEQASSTQNDLLASVMAVALVAVCLPFVHGRARWRSKDLLLLLVAGVGAVLVKPTSVVVAAPFLLWAFVRSARTFRRELWRGVAGAWPAAPIAVLALAFPIQGLRTFHAQAGFVGQEVIYGNPGEVGNRLLGSLRGLVRNIPVLPPAAVDWMSPPQTLGCARPASLCLEMNRVLSEDLTGDVVPAVFLVLVAILGLTQARRLGRLPLSGLLLWLASWVLFHAMFRDNVWVPRLELPLFALAPIGLGVCQTRWVESMLGRNVANLLIVGALLHGAVAVAENARRPLALEKLRQGDAAGTYYVSGPPHVRGTHGAVLRALAGSSCRKLGLFIDVDSYDYPLAWRAMQSGFQVRHVLQEDDWPCAVFSDKGDPPPRLDGKPWKQGSAPGLFVVPEE